LYDLVRSLDDGGAQQIDVKKRLRRVAKKDKVLDVPLDRHELEKVIVTPSIICTVAGLRLNCWPAKYHCGPFVGMNSYKIVRMLMFG